MAHELVGVAQGVVQDGLVTDDDGVFEVAAADEALVLEHLDLAQKTEGASGGDFVFEGLGVDVERGVLRADGDVVKRYCHRNAQLIEGKYTKRYVVVSVVNRLVDLDVFLFGFLFDEAGLFEDAEEWQGTAIAHRDFVGVEFNIEVVQPETDEGGEDMFDGVDLSVAAGDGRAA